MCPALNPELDARGTPKDPDVRYWAENAGPNPFARRLDELYFPRADSIDLEDILRVIPSLAKPSLTFLQRLSSETWDEKHLDDRYKEVWKVHWNKNDGNSVEAVLKMVRI